MARDSRDKQLKPEIQTNLLPKEGGHILQIPLDFAKAERNEYLSRFYAHPAIAWYTQAFQGWMRKIISTIVSILCPK